jgi:hypothetical protein
MEQWEYKTVFEGAGNRIDAKLNSLGEEGWEAISIACPARGEYVIVLKRKKSQS